LALDLGQQPACDHFPAADVPAPDPVYPLAMWVCSECGFAQQRSRMPGSSIPVISPDELIARRPDAVLLFVRDLLAEVQISYPQIEAAGGRWVLAGASAG
jgi:Putative zinc binding domain/C-methyltransferase C-terminal domain